MGEAERETIAQEREQEAGRQRGRAAERIEEGNSEDVEGGRSKERNIEEAKIERCDNRTGDAGQKLRRSRRRREQENCQKM